MEPWDINPALTSERLAFVARLLADVRRDAADAHEADRGDTAWGLGCRAHERSVYAITQAAQGGTADWLQVVEPGLHFVFSIGGVPFRFFRGEADNPPTRSLRRNFPEINAHVQMSLPLVNTAHSTNVSLEYFWRIAIETDSNGRASRIVAVEVAESGATRAQYEIPFDAIPAYVAPIEASLREGREIPPPEVSIRANQLDQVDEEGTSRLDQVDEDGGEE